MNFEKVRRKNRKAISPVLATVILIAITLIAAVAIAGFVFGLFGSFTSSPQLGVNSASCYKINTGADVECNLLAQNTGSGNAGLPGSACTVQLAGSATSGSLYTATAKGGALVTSIAGNTAPTHFFCYVTGGGPTSGASGSTATGNIITANGNIAFAGTWQ